MNNKPESFLPVWALTMLMALGFAFTAQLSAQEKEAIEEAVELIDRDGQAVELDDVENRRLVGGKVEIKNGKVVITNADGTTQEVEANGSNGISVNRSIQTVVENGEKKTVTKGQAIITGPNGERQVIELGDGNAFEIIADDFNMPQIFRFQEGGKPAQLQVRPRTVSKYMLGIHCKAVSAAICSHLKIEEGTGLIVSRVAPDSAAAEAGLKTHDILMYAGDEQLQSLEELNKAVELAGEEDQEISFTLIREGEERSLDIKPTERPAGANFFQDGIAPQFAVPMPLGNPDAEFQFHEMGPGVIIGEMGAGIPNEMKEQLDLLRQQMEQMQKDMENRFNDR